MKKFLFIFLTVLILILLGCGVEPHDHTADDSIYHSDTATEDCYLCGNGAAKDGENLLYWGQDNIALLSLNTFDLKPIEINRYNRQDGQLIEEYAGFVRFGGGGSKDGGFSATLLIEFDRGYASGILDLLDDEMLDPKKVASFLCSDCLNDILPQDISQCFGVGAINLETKELRLFEKKISGFGLGDFHIDCHLLGQDDDIKQIDILIFYCPIRYEEKS